MVPLRIHAFALSEKGIRPNNEDAIFPDPKVKVASNVFVVCDGVGGAEKGEVASAICAKSMGAFLRSIEGEQIEDATYKEALKETEALLKHYVSQHPGTETMSTTLTWLRFTEKEADLGWVGDSRIYHFRGDQTLYRTSDHSLVNAMIKAGDITEEEARTHPQKNVILRAIGGNPKQPNVEMEVHRITNIEVGDRFLLCTDGVSDALTDSELNEICREKDVNAAIDRIHSRCALDSKDNYSCYLLEWFGTALTEVKPSANKAVAATVSETSSSKAGAKENSKEKTDIKKNTVDHSRRKPDPVVPKKSTSPFVFIVPLVLAALGFLGFQYYQQAQETKQYDSLLQDAELFLKNREYQDAIDKFSEAEKLRGLNPVDQIQMGAAKDDLYKQKMQETWRKDLKKQIGNLNAEIKTQQASEAVDSTVLRALTDSLSVLKLEMDSLRNAQALLR